MRLLCLSNGHGEDAIAVRILQALRQEVHDRWELAALPLVGEGKAYINQGIAIVGMAKPMPSGGFVYMDGRQLARDLRQGLLQLTAAQLQTVRQWTAQGGAILAVGDVVPLLFAWWSGAPYAFIGTAKSEYHLRDEQGPLARPSWFEQLESSLGSVYLPWERSLMRHSRCKAVFPRDTLTAERLKRWHIPAFDLGNPMMDDLEPAGVRFFGEPASAELLTIALLPGSRVPEAYENWQTLLQAVDALVALPHRLLLLAAIAPGVEIAPLRQMLSGTLWQEVSPIVNSAKTENLPGSQVENLLAPIDAQVPVDQTATQTATQIAANPIQARFTKANAMLVLTSAFNDCLAQAQVAIAMAGTATEQFVGLGKPAVLLPGKGPQFTAKFAESQARLLGISVILAESPLQTAKVVQSLLQDEERLQRIQANGQRRMGQAGAALRIANQLKMLEFIPRASQK